MACCPKPPFSPSGSVSCGNVAPATPCATTSSCPSVCPEDHTQQIVIQKFNATLITRDAWNIPDCESLVQTVIPGLTNIEIGSYLWNTVYGYFRVDGFNADTSEVTLQNLCNEGNAAVGTEVPACTDFIVTDPPSTSNTNNTSAYPYVAQNFTAPEVGDCVNVTVTTTNGLISGGVVGVSTGQYRVSAVLSANSVTLCNDGDGILPGTIVVAQNGAGEYQYPVALVAVNACENAESNDGQVIVCFNGQPRILAGNERGQVLVLQSDTGNDAAYEHLPVVYLDCTFLTSTFFIVSGLATYVLSVASSAYFTTGDAVTVEGRSERFVVTSVPDGVSLSVTMYPTPGANTSVSAGADVCSAIDCADTQYPNRMDGDSALAETLGSVLLQNAVTNPWVSLPKDVQVTNPSKCRSAYVGICATGSMVAAVTNTALLPSNINTSLTLAIDGAAGFVIATNSISYNFATNISTPVIPQVVYTGPAITNFGPDIRLLLAPQQTATLHFRLRVSFNEPASGWTYFIAQSQIAVITFMLPV